MVGEDEDDRCLKDDCLVRKCAPCITFKTVTIAVSVSPSHKLSMLVMFFVFFPIAL